MNLIAAKLNFSYVIKTPSDAKFGTLNNGAWNGAIRMVLENVRN
jgi:hypothetical protein